MPPYSESEMKQIIIEHHYTHSVPSGKTHAFCFDSAIVFYSIPANYNISRWLLGIPNAVWELTRLWAPDSHQPNLLTQAIADSIRQFRQREPEVAALISYADPNAGHLGGVYRAASWSYLGVSSESRMYRDASGHLWPRRKFHQGRRSMTKAEIEAQGFTQENLPGKHRYARGLTRQARRRIAKLAREAE